MKSTVFSLLFLWGVPLCSDSITVSNKSGLDIYVAIYKQKNVFRKESANRVTQPLLIHRTSAFHLKI